MHYSTIHGLERRSKRCRHVDRQRGPEIGAKELQALRAARLEEITRAIQEHPDYHPGDQQHPNGGSRCFWELICEQCGCTYHRRGHDHLKSLRKHGRTICSRCAQPKSAKRRQTKKETVNVA